MGKLILALLALTVAPHAHALPFASSVEGVADLLTGVFPIIVFLIAVIGASLTFATGNWRAGLRLIMLPVPISGLVLVSRVFGSSNSDFYSAEVATPVLSVVEPEKPDMFAIAFHWIGSHILVLSLGVGFVVLVTFLVNRSVTTRARRARARLDVRDLVNAIEQVDQLRLFWNQMTSENERDEQHAKVCRAFLARSRLVLVSLLEKAHEGTPLTALQRSEMANAVAVFEKVSRNSHGTPIPEEEVRRAQLPRGRPDTVQALQARRGVALPATTAGRAPSLDIRDLPGDLLGPLNELSPISPFSARGLSHDVNHRPNDDEPRQSGDNSVITNDEQRRSFDTPAADNGCRYEPLCDSGTNESCSTSESGSFD